MTEPRPLITGAGSPAQVLPEPMAYRIADACHVLGIGRTSVYDLIKSGEIRVIKIAGRTLVPRSELERLTRVDSAA